MHPLEPVRSVLAAARRGGLDFDTAWAEALELAQPAWREALQATRDGWARAYARQGPHELADIVALRRAAREQDGTQPRRAATRPVAPRRGGERAGVAPGYARDARVRCSLTHPTPS